MNSVTATIQVVAATQKVRPLLHSEAPVTLLRSDETTLCYQVAGHVPSEEDIDQLGDYLEDELPANFDKKIDLTLRPTSESHARVSAGRNGGTRSECIFLAGAKDSQIIDERQLIRSALTRYFNYSSDQEQRLGQLLRDDSIGLRIAVARNIPSIKAVHHMLRECESFLPETVTLSSMVIEDS